MCDDHHGDGNGLGRRALFVTSAAAALTLGSVTFGTSGAEAADGEQETRTIRGTLPTGSPDFVYLPVEVPAGVREFRVSYSYERTTVPAGTMGNALDIGVFDERGTELGGKGFRGWSGGARTEFFIRTDEATPGYLPGPVRPGTWHIALGPYTVAPDGLPYEITITLTYGRPAAAVKPVYPPERAKGRGRAWYRATAICTPGTPTAAVRPPSWRRSRGPRDWTSSTARSTTPSPRTPIGPSTRVTTC